MLCAGASLLLFARRDIGGVAFSWLGQPEPGNHYAASSLSQAERALSTRNVSLQTLRRDGWSAFWWGLGVVFVCAYSLVIALSTQQAFYRLIQETPMLHQLFFDTPTNTNAAMLGTFLFTFMPALVVAFALTLALKWVADLENGRLEVLFSTPQSRRKVLLSRFCANVLIVLLAHGSLDLPRVWQPGVPRRQLDELSGHDRRGPGAVAHQPDPVPHCRYHVRLNLSFEKGEISSPGFSLRRHVFVALASYQSRPGHAGDVRIKLSHDFVITNAGVLSSAIYNCRTKCM